MPDPSAVIRKVAENVIKLGAPATFAKHVFIDEVRKRAAEIKVAGESDAQAFAKCITSDPIGVALYKASKFAAGPDHLPEKPKESAPKVLGPAHAKMQMLADDHLKANPRKSPAGAFAHVYSSPENVKLREQCQQEHLNSIQQAHESAPGAADETESFGKRESFAKRREFEDFEARDPETRQVRKFRRYL